MIIGDVGAVLFSTCLYHIDHDHSSVSSNPRLVCAHVALV